MSLILEALRKSEAERRRGQSMFVARKRSCLPALIDLLNQLGRGPGANAGADHMVRRVDGRQNSAAAPRHFHGLAVPVLSCRHLSMPQHRY